MTYFNLRGAAAASLCLLGFALAAPMAQAKGHDSNTLHKLGNAIQYPIRKASENTSIAAHRTVGENSIEHRRNGSKRYNSVITPKGHIHRLHRARHKH